MEIILFKAGIYWTLFQILQGLHIPLSDKFISETTSVEFISSSSESHEKRSTENQHLPKQTVLRLAVAGTLQHIALEKNYKLDISNIPVYKNNNGQVQRIHVAFDKKHVLYQAPSVGGSFLVTCHKNETSITREIFGSFHHNSSLYVIQSDTSKGIKGEHHLIARAPDQTLVFEGVPSEGLPTPYSKPDLISSYHGNKRTRRQTNEYNIELLSVIDYKSYQFWYDMTSGSDRSGDTVSLVMQYIAYIINSVDMRYKTVTGVNRVLNVLSSGIYIADSAQSSPWSEDNEMNGQVPSSATLDSFRDWVNDQNSLPAYDHAMGFTGYDVVSAGTGDSSGIAYTSVLCTSDSMSVVEDSFSFITMATVAHELGHSLGALHDGQGNTCSGSDNFIMASVNNVVADPNIGQNLWKFSTCSGKEFQTYIDTLDRRGDNCLLTTSSLSYVPTTLKPMAEAYPADQTCVYKYGEGSYVCRSIQDYDTICTSMFCNQPGTSQCYSTIPAEGTPCGRGKWCEQGRCVASSRAPSNNADNCPLGDRPGLFDSTGKTCAQHIEDNKSLCYGDYTGSNCCESCNSKRTGDASCQFGDHGTGFCSSMPRYGCYSNEEYCCGTCKSLKNNALPGCEYGDRFSGCLRENCAQYSAENLAGCCETCFDPAKTVKTTSTSTTTTTTTTTQKTTTSTTSTTPKTTTTTKTISSSVTTKPPTSKSESTTQYTGTTRGTTKGMESTEMPVEKQTSDLIFVVAGCVAGAAIVIVFVIILCICLRRRKAKRAATSGGRKHSKDNAYDNIGFATAASEKPHHPPPRRYNSQSASENNVSNGSTHIPISSIANGSQEHVDGYMMPASVQLTLPPAETVHYTAPNKPKFKPVIPPKKKAFTAPKPSPVLSKRSSKPVHYKRSSGLSNSYSAGSIPETDAIPALDENDSIGEIQKVPQDRRPTLPGNHPASLPGFGRLRYDLANEISKKTVNKVADRSVNVHQKKFGEKSSNISDDEKRKVLPSNPPMPIPRVKSRKKKEDLKASSLEAGESELDIFNNGYEEVDNVKRLEDSAHPLKPPKKPVPRRQISTGSTETVKPEVPLKKSLRPPLKPVPRRPKESEKTAESNLAFEDDQFEIEI